MSKLIRFIIVFIFFSFFTNTINSQRIKDKKQALAKVLVVLEKRYNVKFSYENKTIEGISIKSLDTKLLLKDALEKLRILTDLNFKVLSDRFIVITHKIKVDPIILDEIVIRNYLTKGISKTINGTINATINTSNILPGLIEPDVFQFIQSLPAVTSADERVSNINIRGGTNDQNLILYEEIPMYQSGHFFGLISAFNPSLLEKITISKNGTPAKFGNRVSSVIRIKNFDKVDNKLKAGFGSNLLDINGFAKIPLSKKTSLQVSTRRSFTDILASPTYDSYFDRIFSNSGLNISDNSNDTLQFKKEKFFFHDINAKLLYDINKTSKLRINGIYISNTLDYNQTYKTANNTIFERESSLNQNSYGANVLYSKMFKKNFNITTEAYISSYDLNAVNNDITNGQKLLQENKVLDLGIRFDFSKQLTNNRVLNGGYQFNEVGVTNLEEVSNPRFKRLVKEVLRTHTLYGEIKWESESKNTYLKLGLRGSYIEKFSSFLIEPRFTFNQKFLKHFRFEALGELKNQSIAQIIDLQQDFFGIEKKRWVLADNFIVPVITSGQVSLGISYNHNNLLISAETYYKNVANISARSQGFQNQFQFRNDIGSYTVKGFDFLINKRFNNFSTWFSYAFSDNNYQFDSLYNSFPNVVHTKHAANASFTYNLDNFKIGMGVNWNSGVPYTRPLEIQDTENSSIEYEAPNSSRLNDYVRTDISATYNFYISDTFKAEVGASVWNIFNRTNVINRFYKLNSDNEILKTDTKALKFIPNLSFKVSF